MSDSTDLDSDDDLVELPRLAKHVDHETFDPTYSRENEDQHIRRSNRVKEPVDYLDIDLNDNIQNTLKTLKCDFCQKHFRNPFDIKTHIIAHGFKDNSTKQLNGPDKKRVIPCDSCSQYFPTDIEVMVHKQDYHGVCSVCNITLPSCDTLQQHLDTHTDPTLQRCLICGSGFQARVALFYHLKDKHADDCEQQAVFDTISECDIQSPNSGVHVFYFKCPYCLKSYLDRHECLEHMKIHETDSDLKCKFCNLELENYKRLFKHLFDSHRSKTCNLQCFVCKNEVSINSYPNHSKCYKRILCCRYCCNTKDNTSDLLEHMVKHLIKEVFKCDICEETFGNTVSLKDHKLKHEELQSYTCTLCNIDFINYKHFTVHNRKEHRDASVKYTCKVCLKICDHQFQLTKHSRTHRPKTIKCQFCPKMFHTQNRAKKHEVIHTGEKKFICDICNKAFSQRPMLKDHKLVHSGARPFKCSECEKSFKTRSQLRYHMFSHTGERPYVCDICGQGFTNQTHRKTHMRTHTGETPYLCQHCGAGYPTNAQLQKHIISHTGEIPYLCQHCGASFPTNSQLQKHVLKHQ